MDSDTVLLIIVGGFVLLVSFMCGIALLIWWNNSQRVSNNNREAANKRHSTQKNAEAEAIQAITDVFPLIQSGQLAKMTPEQTQALFNGAQERYPNLMAKLAQKTLGNLF